MTKPVILDIDMPAPEGSEQLAGFKSLLELAESPAGRPRVDISRVMISYDGSVIRCTSLEDGRRYMESHPSFTKKLGVVPWGKFTLEPKQSHEVVFQLGVNIHIHRFCFSRGRKLPFEIVVTSLRIAGENQFIGKISAVMIDGLHSTHSVALRPLLSIQQCAIKLENEGDTPFEIELDVDGYVLSEVFA